MNLKQRVKALEDQPRDRECPPFEALYWTRDKRLVWELKHNPHLDPKETIKKPEDYFNSFYN